MNQQRVEMKHTMKNRYIIAELNSKNEFRITASFNVLGVSINTDVLKNRHWMWIYNISS